MVEWDEQACLHGRFCCGPTAGWTPYLLSVQFSERSVSDSETQNLDSLQPRRVEEDWQSIQGSFPLTFQCSQCLWKPARNAAAYLRGVKRSPLEQVVQCSLLFCNPNSWFPRQAPFLRGREVGPRVGVLVKRR